MINLENNIIKFFDRKLEIEEILSKSNLDPKEFATLSKELSDVTQVTDLSQLINSKKNELKDLYIILKDKTSDADLQDMAKEESKMLENELSLLNKNQIRLKIIGEKKFPKKLNRLLAMSERKTNKNTRLQINLALNYGSKNEIVNSVKKLVKLKKKINIKSITDHLYTKNIPDPDILVRTGDTKRLSNFLLWQLSYSEIFFEKKLWPEFDERDYTKIIN